MNKQLSIISSLLILALVSIAGIVAASYKQAADFQSTTAELRSQNQYLLGRVNEESRRGKQTTTNSIEQLEQQLESSESRSTVLIQNMMTYWGRTLIPLDTATSGEQYGPFTIIEVGTDRFSEFVQVTGKATLEGTITFNAPAGTQTIELTESSAATLPVFLIDGRLEPSPTYFAIKNPTESVVRAVDTGTIVTIDTASIGFSFTDGDSRLSGITLQE